ncbi:uncharacterized protein K452DRAFT_88765 [Aplosporella prunicola CBS 121167]|uniref:Uncharacterized protein n=1 Tax=Aplosporella prunicola CBS 121167 TaxID=1176127 RepID=A0A6A6B711_9PEZI|nr:uncharacterized protein K452DRAFT_88765 [Aplosporella prunicola CBS 121167]KAF2138591.1 hypothetical protein K452DRAFT_88765 [Aplosporella prunicola CBS 121167]
MPVIIGISAMRPRPDSGTARPATASIPYPRHATTTTTTMSMTPTNDDPSLSSHHQDPRTPRTPPSPPTTGRSQVYLRASLPRPRTRESAPTARIAPNWDVPIAR